MQERISQLETEIADRREFYNSCANINNVRISQIPYVVFAQLFAFKKVPLLQFNPLEIGNIKIDEHFSKK